LIGHRLIAIYHVAMPPAVPMRSTKREPGRYQPGRSLVTPLVVPGFMRHAGTGLMSTLGTLMTY